MCHSGTSYSLTTTVEGERTARAVQRGGGKGLTTARDAGHNRKRHSS